MQEEMEHKTVALAIKGTKLTGRLLAKALLKLLAAWKNGQAKGVVHHGKQSLAQLYDQHKGLSDIEISGENIKAFERFAREFKVDYALKKDTLAAPPTWYVFFKAQDKDAMTAAFKKYAAHELRRERRPSIAKQLAKLKEFLRGQPQQERQHNMGGHEL